ncbi:MAG: hypothetical protein M1453_09510 [Acidobacteria bacterium]|nr:hypothetical protein [Acidobacteriota bacterium]MCL5288213.1 hypothetical protein [Acidobacteriota bacterium]
MFEESKPRPEGKFRRILRYTWFIHVAVLLAIAWIFYSRWDADRQIRERAAEKKREDDRRTVEMLGGDRFEILQFYASPGIVRRGERAQVCYGVSNAKAVRIEPRAEGGVWPSLARCVDVAPTKDTKYTLTIEDGKGNTKTATVEVKVSSQKTP